MQVTSYTSTFLREPTFKMMGWERGFRSNYLKKLVMSCSHHDFPVPSILVLNSLIEKDCTYLANIGKPYFNSHCCWLNRFTLAF